MKKLKITLIALMLILAVVFSPKYAKAAEDDDSTTGTTKVISYNLDFSTGIKGDVDGDGEVSIYDVSIVWKVANDYLSGENIEITDDEWDLIDIDGDEKISITDACCILIYYANCAVNNDVSWETVVKFVNSTDASNLGDLILDFDEDELDELEDNSTSEYPYTTEITWESAKDSDLGSAIRTWLDPVDMNLEEVIEEAVNSYQNESNDEGKYYVTIYLNNDVFEENTTVNIPAGQNVTIDLRGHDLYMGNDNENADGAFILGEGSTLKIQDSTQATNDTTAARSNINSLACDNFGCLFNMGKNSSVILYNGSIKSDYCNLTNDSYANGTTLNVYAANVQTYGNASAETIILGEDDGNVIERLPMIFCYELNCENLNFYDGGICTANDSLTYANISYDSEITSELSCDNQANGIEETLLGQNYDNVGIYYNWQLETSKLSSNNIILGDVNLDGKISLADSNLLNKYAAGIVQFNDMQKLAADVNDDGYVDANDALVLQKYMVNIINKLPYTE